MDGRPIGLAIETSGNVGTVAMNDVDPPRLIQFTEGLAHGKQLLPSIESLLKESKAGPPDFLAVGTGPGSYTGLRIGVTVARTLAWNWECPLLGINSLTALAYAAGYQRKPVVALVDAKQGEDKSTAGAMTMPPGVPQEAPSAWTAYLCVADCDAAVDQARGLGGSIVLEPMVGGPMRFAGVLDPTGAYVTLAEYLPA